MHEKILNYLKTVYTDVRLNNDTGSARYLGFPVQIRRWGLHTEQAIYISICEDPPVHIEAIMVDSNGEMYVERHYAAAYLAKPQFCCGFWEKLK